MTRILFVLVWPAVAVLAGCADSVGNVAARQPQQQRVIEGAAPDEVLAEGQAILQREFGRVSVDRAARRVVTAPVEYTTSRDSGTARDLVRGSSTMRRSATLDVGRRGDVTVVRLSVDVERQDTQRQTVMHPQGHRLSDTPGSETPTDRDAATTERQNTVWTRVRRDTGLERALLDELRERFARRAEEAAGTAPPTTAPTAPAPTPSTPD